MRVLFTSTPGRGHVQPMLPLARALVDQGHEVHWAASEDVCARLRGDGFGATEAGLGDLPMFDIPPDIAALPPAERSNHLFAKFFGPRRAEPMLADLLPIVDAWRPDLMICDQAELAGPIAAARAGIPNVTHAFGRLLPAHRVARGGEAVSELWREHGLEPRPYAGTYDHLYLDIYPPTLQTDEVEHVGEIQLIRPALVLESAPTAEPLVYITFGTVFNRDLEPFAVATEAARELAVRVVVTLGPGHEPEALGDQPANVRVAEFIPQEELLPECAVVLSHAGSGTFLAALAAGVPQVLVPRAADQFLNAEAGAAGGVGVAVGPEDLAVPAVREAITRVLEDEEMRQATRRVRDEIAAMPTPEAVADKLARRFG